MCPKGKFLGSKAYIKELQRSHTRSATAHLKDLEQKEVEIVGGKKISKSGLKSKKKKRIPRINETKSWLCDKTNKIDKSLSKLTKRQAEDIQISKIRKEKGGYHNRH